MKFMRKKLLMTIFFIFLLGISCGKAKKIENQKMISEGEKYNEYIRIYNKMLTINQEINNYFEFAGKSTKFTVPTGRSLNTNISLDKELIDRLKANISKEPKMDQMDKIAKDILPILEEMLPVTDRIWIYYADREYVNDNYAEAQKLHTKLLVSSKKFERALVAYRNVIEKTDKEKKEKDLKTFKKNDQVIRYSLMMLMSKNEEILKEIQKQNLNVENFTEADVEKFKELQKEITKIYNDVRTVVVDEEIARKEGFLTDDFAMFMNKENDFRAGVTEFINRIEKKEGASKLILNDISLAPHESGTPENLLYLFNETVKEYNNLLNKRVE